MSENFKWNIINSFTRKKGFVSHQIDTFDDYINNGIARVIAENDIVIEQKDAKYTISFNDVYIPNPSIIEEDRTVRVMLPSECRQRDLTYDSPIFVNISEKVEIEGQETEIIEHKRILIGRTPIMLLSDRCNLKKMTTAERVQAGECEQEHFGYFLIRGKERALIGQLRGIYNQVIVLEQKSTEKYKFTADVRSMSESTGHSVQIQAKIGADDRTLVFNLPYIKEHIEMGIVFKALGYTEDQDIYDIIGNKDNNPKINKYIKYIIRDSYHIKTQEEALLYISQFTVHVIKEDKKINYASQVVENELLPHMGIFATIKEKTFFLGHMVNKLLLTAIGLRKEDDRDNYANKRVEMAGVLCCELFRTLFKRFIKAVEMQVEKKKQRPDILSIISRNNGITTGLKSCFCFVEGTPITMGNGLSYPIEKLCKESDKQEILGLDTNTSKIIRTVHGGVMKQEIKDTMKLTFSDGRTITCTPDHRFSVMNEDGKIEWVEANKIPLNSRVLAGLDYPIDNLEEENPEWKFVINYETGTEIKKKVWKINTQDERNKTLAFMRILGFMLTNGYLADNKVDATVYIENMFDVETFLSDYKLITKHDDVKITDAHSDKWGSSYNIRINGDIYYMITSIPGVKTGKKVNTARTLPDFILDESCPKSIVREFLGGLFGGDGGCPRLDIRKDTKTTFESIHFSWSTNIKYIDELKNTMENICSLIEKLGIKGSYINGPYFETNEVPYYRITLQPNTDFIKNIGFRYCIYKSYKVSAISCYWRYIEEIKRQHNFIVDRTSYLYENDDKIRTLGDGLAIAKKELKEKEYILNEHYSLPDLRTVQKRRTKGRSNELKNLFAKYGIPDAEDFIKDLGVYDWFKSDNKYVSKRESTKLPYFTIKLLNKRMDKPQIVYDVTNVKITSSFLANGVVTKNSTGNWSCSKTSYVRTGVSQVVSRLTYGATLSHLRRIVIPTGKEGKNAKIRQIHSSQIMYICPTECFDPETPILTWDGTIKLAKNIVVGDLLIDDKGFPTRVRKTISGVAPMYEVKTKKNNFLDYTVTSNHILTLKIKKHKKVYYVQKKNRKPYYEVIYFDKQNLKHVYKSFSTEEKANVFRDSIKEDDIIDINISDYLKLPHNVKDKLVIFKIQNINWNKKEVLLDPYILGMWLGDGLKSGYNFASADEELINFWKNWDKSNDDTYAYGLSSAINSSASLKNLLEKYDLVKNKHIPKDYLINDRDTRLKVLAGLIDTNGNVSANGHEIRICQGPKNSRIIHDAFFLAQSLGFSSHLNEGVNTWTDEKTGEKKHSIYEELSITGEFLYEIPTILERKKLNELARIRCSSFLQSPFKLKEKTNSPFVGWQVEGSGRFLLSDFSVTHNTPEGQSIGIVMNLSLTTMVTKRIPTVIVQEIIEKSENLIFINDYEGPNDKTKIFLNGVLMGITLDPEEFLIEMREFRESGLLSREVSFSYEDEDIKIFCDEGRFIRPLLTLNKEGKLNITEKDDISDWDELIEKRLVQYVDNSEIQNCVVAMNEEDLHKYKNDFCEICPAAMLGVMASIIPFPDHNQCIKYNEPVYMSNGTTKKISDVKVGDKVITFHPETQNQSIVDVTHVYTNVTNKPLYQITTVSGRKITATFDHRFMTYKGWTRLEDLVDYNGVSINNTEIESSYIGISLEPKPVNIEPKNVKILIEKIDVCVRPIYSNKLNHLLPLKTTSECLPMLSRMIGYTFFNTIKHNDESNYFILLDFKHENDITMFENDVKSLKLNGISYGLNKKKIIYEGLLPYWLLLNRHNDHELLEIPEWILDGSDMVKREFLAGFKDILTQKFMFNKNIKNVEKFAQSIVKLFADLDIDVKDIIETSSACEKDININVSFRINPDDIVKLFDKVNYRYNYNEKIKAGIMVEYKRCNIYNVSEDDWKNMVKVKSTTLFIPIQSIQRSTETIISDITVNSANQSFLCGDAFCVHNSPRNIYQCLSPDTDVLLSNGSRKQIKDIKIGDEVVTFCNKTMAMSKTKVIHQYIRPTENKIYKLTTISGRSIIATGNHNFMTTKGWLSVDKMKQNTKIGIALLPIHMSNEIKERKLILDETMFIDILSKTRIKDSLIYHHLKILKGNRLIPLYNDDNRLYIIAKIYGFTSTDGCINIYNKKHGGFTPQCMYDFGSLLDYNDFENNVEELGFSRCIDFERTDGHTWHVSHNGAFPTFLIALGISYGKKTETKRNPIPDWIMNGSDIIKREFISGFQGGDGCQIRWNRLKDRKSYNFVCAMTSQQINPIYNDSLSVFFKQCVELLTFFGIETSYIPETKTYEKNRVKFGYKISDKQENLIKYYDTIGYRYSYHKNINSGKVIEYLKYKKNIVDDHISLVQNIRNDFDLGFTNSQLRMKYNVKYTFVSDTIKSYKVGRKISAPNLYDHNIEDWLDAISDQSTSIFIPIKTIEEIPNQLISDITVESENHSFIAGDNFLSSNSSMGQLAQVVLKILLV